jgi:hypothetical protein
MRLGHPAYGIVERESPRRVHRFGVLAGQAYCGQAIVALPAGEAPSSLLVCRRCSAIDESRRDDVPTLVDDY